MENKRENNKIGIEIDLFEIFGILLGRIWIILNVGLLAALACFAVSRFILGSGYPNPAEQIPIFHVQG